MEMVQRKIRENQRTPACRWTVYPTPFDVTGDEKASAPSHKGGGEGYCKFKRYKSFFAPLFSQKKRSG
ncbi:MAG: hypothetical protein ACI4JQ_00665, partial [Ruminococcus sp.]